MCYYRYHYYSQCSHGELYCFRTCDKSKALVAESNPNEASKAAISEATKDQSKPTSQPNKHKTTKAKGRPPSTKAKDNSRSTKTKRVNTGTIHQDPSFTHHHRHHRQQQQQKQSSSNLRYQTRLLRSRSTPSLSINTNKHLIITLLLMSGNVSKTNTWHCINSFHG